MSKKILSLIIVSAICCSSARSETDSSERKILPLCKGVGPSTGAVTDRDLASIDIHIRNSFLRKFNLEKANFEAKRLKALEQFGKQKFHCRFKINSEGVVEDVQIIDSSGSKVIDQEAMNLIKSVGPFKLRKSKTISCQIQFPDFLLEKIIGS